MSVAMSQPSAGGNRRAATDRARRKVIDWFAARGWSPFRFQRQVWNACLAGRSGLLHATTGTGKTYAIWLAPLIEYLAASPDATGISPPRRAKRNASPPLRVLWLTPLRALSADTEQALARPLGDLKIPWTLESRTGDSSSALRARQRERLPTALVTTPESLSLLLSRSDAREQFAELSLVVVDEWHELLASKRGVQVELALARLRGWRHDLRVWGLSATLGNLDEALSVLVGPERRDAACLITGGPVKRYHVETVIPEQVERFSWAGHLGLRQVSAVAAAIDACRTALVFTNTRYQAEQWYQSLLKARPAWAGQIALHHGSLDQGVRRWVETELRSGRLRCVVCTSSLDLGVDFSPVDRVFQIGSPKGIARLLQRAGRSGHQPGVASRITCVPTHAFELVEVAAARSGLAAGRLEGRRPPELPLDVLVQHAVTVALGQGFERDALLAELRTTHTFGDLTDADWDWVLDFITRGGSALAAYPDYHRVAVEGDTYRVVDRRIATQHRLSIGTIASDAALRVKYLKGPALGTIEESFIARLSPGDRFTFAGKRLKLVRVRDMTVWVRKSTRDDGPIPRWMGGRLPLSTELAAAVRDQLAAARAGQYVGPEMQSVRPLLELQAAWSQIPDRHQLLIEQIKTRRGHHLFLYPFAGRSVHEGLAALLAYRLSRRQPISFAMTVNDYGFELLAPDPIALPDWSSSGLFSSQRLADDILASLNSVEMARRQFREIARIAGLILASVPGQQKSARQVQASASLLYDVFTEYDPQNRLLHQARREVLERQLEHSRLKQTLDRLAAAELIQTAPARLTPLAFPLWVDRQRERLSSETLADRVRRMQHSLERAADRDAQRAARRNGRQSGPK